jgi:hypothetical protein
LHNFQKRSESKKTCGIGGRLHLPLKLKPSKCRATIEALHKSTLTFAKSVPSSMETRKRPRQPIPRRRENQNILPLPK